MTIAIALRVNDGVVLAADSASTMVRTSGDGRADVVNVYNNANKILNLHKALPIGAMTWGMGQIGNSSITTLLKDLRVRFTRPGADHYDWKLDTENYTVEQVAQRAHQFIHDERVAAQRAQNGHLDRMGIFITGYSTGNENPDTFLLEFDEKGHCPGPQPVGQDPWGIYWNGLQEPIHRLLFGFSGSLGAVLHGDLGVPEADLPAALDVIQRRLYANMINAAMPIQDAIDLAIYLADVTAGYSRFIAGANVVGGPIEVAAITKHEGFKWVQRKYYYERALNPIEGVN